jgi:methyl coenzyme M reductase beta subunit
VEKEKEKVQAAAKKQVLDEAAMHKVGDPVRLIKRNKLLVQAKENNLGIQAILDREHDGTLSLIKHDEIPSLETCIRKLTEIWTSNGAMLAQVLPHDLMNDHDAALEFEVEIIITA